MKYLHKHQLLEQIIYATMWILILGAPFLNFLLDANKSNSNELWEEVTAGWVTMLPFFLLFLIHNYILISKFLLKKYYTEYALSLIFTITVLFLILPEYLKAFSPVQEFPQKRVHPIKKMPQDSLPYINYPSQTLNPRDTPHFKPPIRPPFILIHITIAILLVGFNLTIRLFLKALRDEETLKELEHQHLESELQYLKYQLNPHFFMNTLNNIHALVDLDANKAKQTIIELSKLMSYILYKTNKDHISLENEIDFLKNYIALMKLRYTEQLSIQMDAPLIVPDVQIPPLLFISLLENAFKHGVSYHKPSFIKVSITRTDDGVAFTCHNSKHTCTTDQHHGIGINNIKKRLHLLYGNNYTFTITEDAVSYHVLLIIPTLS